MTLSHSAALENLARIGKLKLEPPDARERTGLLRSAAVRLADARKPDLSLESRFDLAYNAAHGYRSDNCFWCFSVWSTRWGTSRSNGFY